MLPPLRAYRGGRTSKTYLLLAVVTQACVKGVECDGFGVIVFIHVLIVAFIVAFLLFFVTFVMTPLVVEME